MASRAGTGMKLDLDSVPQRAEDLTAYEMMLSESQERMMVVVEKGSEEPFLKVFRKWGLTAVPCGEVLGARQLVVFHGGEEVAKLPNTILADEGPDYDRPIEEPAAYTNRRHVKDGDIADALKRVLDLPEPRPAAEFELAEADTDEERLLRRVLASPTVAAKSQVYQQYDYMVRTNTLHAPGPSDAAVIRIKETGQGLAVCTDGSGRHVALDPRLGGARAVLEATRNVLAVGAKPLGITNCLNFGNPERPDRMWQFVRTIDGMRDALTELELPVTGGNVSFYNETAGASVLPTPVIGMVGLLDKAEDYLPSDVLEPGCSLFLMGSCSGRLDGSTLLYDLGRLRAGVLDSHNYVEFRECERFLTMAAGEDAIAACHDVSDGGLLAAVAETCPTGADIDISKLLPDIYDDERHNLLGALFSEEGHRWLIAVRPDKLSWVRTAAFHFSVPLIPLGQTIDGEFVVNCQEREVLRAPMRDLNACYRGGLVAAVSR